jgi:hypothetical protein
VKRLLSLAILGPLGVALVVLSIANRQPVTLRLDPLSEAAPALSVTWPFFAFLFAAALAGIAIGGIGVWIGQGRHRKAARLQRAEAERWRAKADEIGERADALAAELAAGKTPSLPAAPSRAA